MGKDNRLKIETYIKLKRFIISFILFSYVSMSYHNITNYALSSYDADDYSRVWNATDTQLGHDIGQSDGMYWKALTASHHSGLLSYGPYVSDLKKGVWTVTWSLSINDNTFDNASIVRLEIYDYDSNQIIEYRDVTRNQFVNVNQFQDFSITYASLEINNRIEFRTYWYDSADVMLKDISTKLLKTIYTIKKWGALNTQIGHQIGRADGTVWSANTSQDSSGYLVFGPYVNELSLKEWSINWTLQIDKSGNQDENVARLEVYDTETGLVIAGADIKKKEFLSSNHYQRFSLNFIHSDPGHRLEFRVHWYATDSIRFKEVLAYKTSLTQYNTVNDRLIVVSIDNQYRQFIHYDNNGNTTSRRQNLN